MKLFHRLLLIVFLSPIYTIQAQSWSKAKAAAWYKKQGWLAGANFIPSTAVNQLEMWQGESFDPTTINRELGYAESIGFNVMRVYLHHVAWVQDPEGFKGRIKAYLKIAHGHHIKTMFVFFDDCWKDQYHAGPQPAPTPSVHNSGWLKDPGGLIDTNPALMDTLENYVKDVLQTFRKDKRVIAWDLYNEPGHFGHGDKSWPLLKNVVAWSRSIPLRQPVTIGIWNKDFKAFNAFQLENSDVISYHNYRDSSSMRAAIDTLKGYGRPLFCTEYMKRVNQSTFMSVTPMLKKENVAAINWGLVAGKTQTNYPQGNKGGEPEPQIWYHDIFKKDGTPFSQQEIQIIRHLTLKP
ncbi:1,4-beta-xylanase [Chitinophaga sp. CC14]|uniref:cellulase family glycosylhydrolase n=1 Tax=Chitinophaga sp. CC14 TaxID=3029199 RepID=UPI003B77D998